jgi:hypothetical protein
MHPIDTARAENPNSTGIASVGDIKMHYEIRDQGEPMLMIMGLADRSME